jgi:hypothetical protein
MFAACVLAGSCLASAAQALEVSGDVYAGYYDKYLWRGFNLSGSKPVVQGGVDLSTHGFTVSYWSNYQARDARNAGLESGDVTETDITLDYSIPTPELVSVNVGNILYDVDGFATTNELYVATTLNTLLSPSVKIYWDYDECEEEGVFVSLAVGHTFELTDKLGLSAGAAANYNFGSDFAVGNYHGWHNYELSLGADYAVTENVTISPSFLFSERLSNSAKEKSVGPMHTQYLAGISASLSF